MKRIVSNLLYVLFFGFAITLMIACFMLFLTTANRSGSAYNNIEAIEISDSGKEEADYEPIDTQVYEYSAENYRLVDVKSGYNALDTDVKRDLYDRIRESVYSVTNDADGNGRYRTSRIRIPGSKLSEFDIREVVNAYISDNPEIFWIENVFGYAYVEDNTIVEFYSVISSDECEKYIDRFNQRVDEILSAVGTGRTEYQREKIVHDKLISNCTYKTGVTTSSDGWQYFSAYGAIVEGEAVCEGYSKAVQLLMTRVGIVCSTVRGEADGVAHMWNVVEMNGEWYHLDATWDDNDDNINYEYFNVTTEDICSNHTISPGITEISESQMAEEGNGIIRYNFFVPMCTSKDMNYYYAEGVLVQSFDSKLTDTLSAKIRETALVGDCYVPIRFGTEMTYNEYFTKMFNESPYEFYYCIECANDSLDDKHKIKTDGVSVLKNEAEGTLRVKISYQFEDD